MYPATEAIFSIFHWFRAITWLEWIYPVWHNNGGIPLLCKQNIRLHFCLRQTFFNTLKALNFFYNIINLISWFWSKIYIQFINFSNLKQINFSNLKQIISFRKFMWVRILVDLKIYTIRSNMEKWYIQTHFTPIEGTIKQWQPCAQSEVYPKVDLHSRPPPLTPQVRRTHYGT